MATGAHIRRMQGGGRSSTWCMSGTPRAMSSRSKKSDQALTPGSLYILYCRHPDDSVVEKCQTRRMLALRTGGFLEGSTRRCRHGAAAGVALKKAAAAWKYLIRQHQGAVCCQGQCHSDLQAHPDVVEATLPGLKGEESGKQEG